MMQVDAITHGGPPRAYRVCRCARCKVERRCTPDFDFYTFANQPEGPIFCLDCLKPAADEAGYRGEEPDDREECLCVPVEGSTNADR